MIKVAIHAIGDKANDMILDMYESVAAANGERDRRFRVKTNLSSLSYLLLSLLNISEILPYRLSMRNI